jgi:uncharacterized membrane protein HdeD (DUF308 family)
MEKKLKSADYFSNFSSLEANWWVFGLRGISSIIFGILAAFMPIETVLAITILFGAYAIVDGVFTLVSGINGARKKQRWGTLVASGVLSIAAGVVVLIWPQIASISLTAFLWGMISMWAITTGIFEIAAAIRLRREIPGEWLLVLSGILSLTLGVGALLLFWFNPLASLVTLGLFISYNWLASGITQLLLAFKLFRLQKNATPNVEEMRTNTGL